MVLFWVKFSLILFTVQLSLLSTRFHSWLIHFKIQAHKSQTVFLQFLKILHLHFTNNIPAMRNEMRISPKQDPGLMAVKSLRIYFHISRFWFFNRILLSGKISLNRSPNFFYPYNHTIKQRATGKKIMKGGNTINCIYLKQKELFR